MATIHPNVRYVRDYKHMRRCADCNVAYAWYVMQFDHIPELGPKLFNISNPPARVLIEEIVAEMRKCEVVCANCHATRTFNRANGRKARERFPGEATKYRSQ